jgi:hypothetical protein
MDDAVIFARAYEQQLAWHEMGPQYMARGAGRTGTRYAPPQGVSSFSAPSGTTTATPTKSSPPVVHLSPAEIAQRCKDNKCFHCDEFFTNGHKQQCKQLFVIEVFDATEEDADHGPTTNEPTISILALTGIHPRKGRTMQVFVTIYKLYYGRWWTLDQPTFSWIRRWPRASGSSSTAAPGSALPWPLETAWRARVPAQI